MRQRPAGDDRGYSLIELVVAMTIISFVTVVIVGALGQIYSGTKRIDNTAEARDQLDNSFRRLDRELRYANWIAKPGQVGDTWYMEFATPDGCRQLKLAKSPPVPIGRAEDVGTYVLTMASWTLPEAKGTPMVIAGRIRPIEGTDPFLRYRAGVQPSTGMGANYRLVFHQARLYFNVDVGSVLLPFDSTFTAQNTDLNTAEQHECGGGRT